MIYTIILLVLVSGLVAYLGDLLGRRMGKRRLRLFGMRPRHTAILVTSVTGMLIAALTFGTLMTIDSRMRLVFTQGLQLAEKNEALASKYEANLERNNTLRKLNLQLLDQSSKLTREVNEKSVQVSRARKESQDAFRARDLAQLQMRGLARLIDIRQAELSDLRRTGKLTEGRLRQVSESLQVSSADLRRIKSELRVRNGRLDVIQKDLDTKVAELDAKSRELEVAQKDILTAQSTIEYNKELIKKQQEDIKHEAERNELYATDMVIAQGTEIGRRVIDADLPPGEVREQLTNLLQSASDKAKAVHAGSDASKRAIRLVFVDSSRDIVSNDEDTCIEEAVKTIYLKGRSGPVDGVVAIVTVVRNTLKDETALVDLQLRWNRLAFQRGDNIARGIVDGKQSEGRVLLAVMDFLRNNVRAAAAREGVIPIATSDPDKAVEPISDKQLDLLIDLVETIRTAGKQVELKAVAEKDIYVAGPINLDNIGFAISTMVTAER